MGKVLPLRGVRPTGWNRDRWTWLRATRHDDGMTSSAKVVAQSLIDFANSRTGECRPGVATIARDCGITPRTADRCLTELQDRGWIARMGGNAPGIPGRIEFRFPETHAQPAAHDHKQSVGGTHSRNGRPPITPHKDKPRIKHGAPPNPLARYQQPDIGLTIIEAGSLTAKRWDEWLIAEGFPTLDQFGLRHGDGYAMPVDAAPVRTEKVAYNIALQWANWLRSMSAP